MSKGFWIGAGLVGGGTMSLAESSFGTVLGALFLVGILGYGAYFPTWALIVEDQIGNLHSFWIWAIFFYIVLLICMALLILRQSVGALIVLLVLMVVSLIVNLNIAKTIKVDRYLHSQGLRAWPVEKQTPVAPDMPAVPTSCLSLIDNPVNVTPDFFCRYGSGANAYDSIPYARSHCSSGPVYIIFGPSSSNFVLVGRPGAMWSKAGVSPSAMSAAMRGYGCK
jgi:hypothetical protein